MNIRSTSIGTTIVGGWLAVVALCPHAFAQSSLIESGSSLLAPSIIPIGGYAANPQEYLVVAWSVSLSGSDYLYSYTVHNPAGDVLLNPATGALTSTPEIFDMFSVDFDTTQPGSYVSGSQSGAAFREVNNIDLAWFFSPSVPAGSSAPTVSFLSTLPPIMGYANASDGVPPSPWSSIAPGGNMVPVPDPVPEPDAMRLIFMAALLPLGLPVKRWLA